MEGAGMMRRLTIALCAALALVLVPPTSASARRSFIERHVRFEGAQLYVRDYPGKGPALVLMHGFPDNLHLYDRLIPYLRGRRVVAFDFLGWGRSDKPRGHTYTFAEQERELNAVVKQLRLGSVVPVAHDASGPAAINWALAHEESVASLVLLNTFYSAMPTTNPPEAIRIYSNPVFRDLAEAIAANPRINRWLFEWQVGRFITNRAVRKRMVKALWRDFVTSVPAFVSLNRDLIPAVTANTARESDLRAFDRPVEIVFGARDPYLNPGIARRFHELLPTSELSLLPARHYVQVDVPARVARILRRASAR
jgi:haloalkane dehalogenase